MVHSARTNMSSCDMTVVPEEPHPDPAAAKAQKKAAKALRRAGEGDTSEATGA